MNFIFHFLYRPVICLLQALLFWIPAVRARKSFERRNLHDPLCRSFRSSGEKADYCFEFSSEGEYQQAAGLIADALCMGKKLELVLFSPSVERAITELASKHPSQIRYLRFPLLKGGFLDWISADKLILIRYDLFPEFLVWASRPGHRLRLLWMTFKKEKSRGESISKLKRRFLALSDLVVYASEADAITGKELGHPGRVFDFRLESIRRRLEKRGETFKRHFRTYPEFERQLSSHPRQKRLIVGNAWPSDLFLLKDLPADVLLVVVPHQLRADIIETFLVELRNLGRVPVEINEGTEVLEMSSTYLINQKGILCELYADFGRAYVGGGFGVSIHSVLEPLVAGNDAIACGPRHDRSTEYDLARTFDKMTCVNTSTELLEWLERTSSGIEAGKLDRLVDAYPEAKREVFQC
jgi:hypothetical protein